MSYALQAGIAHGFAAPKGSRIVQRSRGLVLSAVEVHLNQGAQQCLYSLVD